VSLRSSLSLRWSRNSQSFIKRKSLFRLHERLILDPILSQLNSRPYPHSYVFKVYFNIISPPMSMYPTLPFSFSKQNVVYISYFPWAPYMSLRSHPLVRSLCGGGVEYLHRDPASRRRRWKGKSRIWDSKIWPRVLRDSDPKITALARASSNCKGQTRPLVREGALNQQTRNCQTIIKIWS
jgi:hypothetical protein